MNLPNGKRVTRDLAPPSAPKKRPGRVGQKGLAGHDITLRKFPPDLVRRVSEAIAVEVQLGYIVGRQNVASKVAEKLGLMTTDIVYIWTTYTSPGRR